MARRDLTDEHIRDLKPKPKVKSYLFHHPNLPAKLYVRVQQTGVKSYVVVARDPNGKQHWPTIGRTDKVALADAKAQAEAIVARIERGEPEPETLAAVVENWMQREGHKKITRAKIKHRFDKYLLPRLGKRIVTEIGRRDIASILDAIEDDHGASTADHVLADLRMVMNWHAARIDGWVPPFVRKMGRSKSGARDRRLDDAEVRGVWEAADRCDRSRFDRFGAIVKTLLCTGQRLGKVLSMTWDDLSFDGEHVVWTIPKGPEGSKGTPDEPLILPPLIGDVIRKLPHHSGSEWVFKSYRGTNRPVSSASDLKKAIDAELPDDFKPWRLHDLRRTMRSVLTEEGVDFHTAERVLGHRLNGVAGTYDRSKMTLQIAQALGKLATRIEKVLAGYEYNVVPFARPASS